MRRLPIYFLIDVSESMVGDPIQHVEEGLSSIVQALRVDPHALETVWVSILVFAGKAKTLVPLQEITSFYPPKFPIGGGTSLSTGLKYLMGELKKNIVKNTPDQKGDWKPIVFLFTDGVPTDDTKAAVEQWKQNWSRSANLVAVSFGDETDNQVLSSLTENLLHFKNTNAAAYNKFFKWVTDSIKTSSMSVGAGTGNSFELAKIDGETVSSIDLSKERGKVPQVDSNFVVLTGKCQSTKRPYLIKYAKRISEDNIAGLKVGTRVYRLVGGFQVDNSYFELSDASATDMKVSTSELMGAPTCPCCGNQFSFAVCACGKIHCVGNEKVSTCPWCEKQGIYDTGEGGFDVTRAKG